MDDIDEALNNIVLAEDRFQQEGYEEGSCAGKKAGLHEGTLLGIEQGAKIGSELGFYYGFAHRCSNQTLGSKDQTRVVKAIKLLLELIDGFPLNNPHDPSIEQKMLKIRAKFKQISSLLHISTEPTNTSISF